MHVPAGCLVLGGVGVYVSVVAFITSRGRRFNRQAKRDNADWYAGRDDD